MAHDPCAGHQCDHCWVCTKLGVCCAQVPNIKQQLSADHFGAVDDDIPVSDRKAELQAAIEAEAEHLTTAQMIQIDIEARLVLAAPSLALTLQITAPEAHYLPPGEENNGLLLNVQADIEHAYIERGT